MNKQEKIDTYLLEPIKVGDKIIFTGDGNGSQMNSAKATATVLDIQDGCVVIPLYGGTQTRQFDQVRKCVRHIGDDPFIKNLRVDQFRVDIEGLMHRLDQNKIESFGNIQIPELNIDPFFTDVHNNQIIFQRGLEWDDDQKKKLINSIYNGMDIGKFIVRNRSYEWVEKRVNLGLIKGTAFKDLVDGKQRATTIADFMNDKFADFNGNYFSEFSKDAKYKFIRFGNLSYGEISDKATDKEVRDYFLNVNDAGKAMAVTHIEFVKNIEL